MGKKTMPDQHRPIRVCRLQSVAFLCAIGWLLQAVSGCAFSSRVQTPRTSWEQILATEAIDRSLNQLEWPDMSDKSIFIEIGPPGDVIDDLYLQSRIEVMLTNGGARITRNVDQADYVLTCLVGAIGLDISGRLFGLEGSAGGLIPFTIPELSIYKTTTRRGFAKTEIHVMDVASSEVVHRSGPVEGSAYRRSNTYLFVFETRKSDTTRLE
jgi:hypothetical protein